MTDLTSPIYLDWKFWSAIFSLIAIILSQIPPLYLLFRAKRLDVDVYGKIHLFHAVGNPSANLVVSLHNTGGKALRISSLELNLTRDGKQLTSLSGLNYFENPSSNSTILFIPFILKPNEIWTHSVLFYNESDRETEKFFREHESKLRAYFQKTNPDNDKSEKVEAHSDLIEPFYKIFDNLFIWFPGEYSATLLIKTSNNFSVTQKYRFTLYESDSNNLKLNTANYKYGVGICYPDEVHKGERITLSEKII